jgi:hypothetical protein
LKENNPEKYEMKMNEWFDTVHPYWWKESWWKIIKSWLTSFFL